MDEDRVGKMETMAGFYSQFMGRDDLVFDIRANIGNRTRVAPKRWLADGSLESPDRIPERWTRA
jgi:hypothetical protein